ncbi:hypothetical protein BSA16_26585, partial [Micromonospora sp. Rc5]
MPPARKLDRIVSRSAAPASHSTSGPLQASDHERVPNGISCAPLEQLRANERRAKEAGALPRYAKIRLAEVAGRG